MRHQSLRLGLKPAVTQIGDVVAGGERRLLAGDDHAAGIELTQGGGEPVEDRVVERAALAGVGDGQPRHAGRGLVD